MRNSASSASDREAVAPHAAICQRDRRFRRVDAAPAAIPVGDGQSVALDLVNVLIAADPSAGFPQGSPRAR